MKYDLSRWLIAEWIGTFWLVSIPMTNTSVNPARSTGPALIIGGWALAQLFWVAPLLGGAVAGFIYRVVFAAERAHPARGA